MNRLDRPDAGADRVIPADDVLCAGTSAVGARDDAAREHRLREVDRAVASIRAEELEMRLVHRRRRTNPPAHDGNVFLSAINQLDMLGGVWRRDEVRRPAAGGEQEGDQRAAGAGSARAGRQVAGRLLARGVGMTTLHGVWGGSLTGRRRKNPSKNHAWLAKLFKRGLAGDPSRLSLNLAKV